MKTKEQILEWLDKQPWRNEFYENCFKQGLEHTSYDGDFMFNAFAYDLTPQGCEVWSRRSDEYQKWYNSDDRPMSWEEYCEKNDITEKDWCITGGCLVTPCAPERPRNSVYDAGAMSKELCEAFIAYMKLIQLRNAWVKNDPVCIFRYKISCWDNIVYYENENCANRNGLSFSTMEDAMGFISTFRDLIKTAKPLL